jgi:hypothetical protein
MGNHPLNLALRFILELCALASVGFGGWNISNEWFKYVLAVLFPIILASIWGVFNVQNDPSRSGKALIPISGITRIILEIGIFAIAIWTLYKIGFIKLVMVYGVFVIAHYVLSYDRIKWLISR